MYRLKQDHVEELEIKKSRFLCYLHRVDCEEDAKTFLAMLKKEHPNANHHCYAFLIGAQNEIQRSNDDGEPAGTAGVPMLDCLSKQQMENIMAVCVRYFGGVKLGAGGLIRAYSKSVSNALSNALLTKKVQMHKYALVFSYDLIGKLDYYFREQQIEVIGKEYEEFVHYEVLSLHFLEEAISEITNGIYLPTFIEDVFIDVDIHIE